MLQNFYYLVPGIGCFLLFLYGHGRASTVISTIGIVGFLACIAAGAYMDRYRFRNYRCPQCGSRLPRKDLVGGEREITYDCASCDVTWDTGLRIPD